MDKFADWPQIAKSFIAYPFRLYFLLSAFSIIPLACVWTLTALGWWLPTAAPVDFHAYGFLNIVGGAAFAGFLFTAMPEWTHHTRNLSHHAALTAALWFAATLTALFSPTLSAWLMLPFWLYLLVFCTVLAHRVRDDSQTALLLMLLCITLLNTCFAYSGALFWLKQLAHAFIIGVLLVMFRIGKAIGQKALENTPLAHCVFVPNPFYRNLSVWFLYAYLAANIFLNDIATSSWLSLAVGLAIWGRLREWHHTVLLRRYYVRWYYLTLLLLGTGYIWQGYAGLFSDGLSLPFHLLMIGGYLLMLMQVFSIAGAVHSSLKLHYPLSSRIGLLLIAGAAFSRTAASAQWPQHYPWFAFYLPAALLSSAFILYLITYLRIFTANPPLPVTPAAGIGLQPEEF